MARDGVANTVNRLQERGFDPRRVGHDSWESRCPAHRSADHALSKTRNEHNHVVLKCRSTQNCQDARIFGALGFTNDHVYAETPDWLISRLARVPIQPASIASPDATDSNAAGASAVGGQEGSDASADGSQDAMPCQLEVGAQGDALSSQALSAVPISLPTSPASPIEQMLGRDLELHVSSISSTWAIPVAGPSRFAIGVGASLIGPAFIFAAPGDFCGCPSRPVTARSTCRGIDDFVLRGDLRDRSVFPHLTAIPATRRQTEREFWPAFRADYPRILGGVLDAILGGLRELPSVNRKSHGPHA